MRKKLVVLMLIIAIGIMNMAMPSVAFAKDITFVANNPTAYASKFINDCQSQQWFLDKVETILNQEQKTINTLTSSADLNNIKELGFADRNISGSIPRAIGEFKELRYLFLSGNNLSGNIPTELYSLPKLENVDLTGNDYKNMSVPTQFGTMASLKVLMLGDNQFTGNIPSSILNNTKIEVLDISSNRLTGTFPNVNTMTGLRYIALSNNTFSGSLSEVSNLSKLHTFSAWGCNLTGTIPASFYARTTLQILDLDSNKLTGTISSSIGALTNLQYFSVGQNGIEGEIPPTIGNLLNLERFDISDNKIRGTIPDVFTNMPRLEEVHMENNYLRGYIPDSLKDKYDNGVSVYSNNNYLTGTNLKDMDNNQDNFCDDTTNEQYQLFMSPNGLKLTENVELNIYPYLKNYYYKTGAYGLKDILLPTEYIVNIILGDSTKLDPIRIDPTGIYIKAIGEILAIDKIKLEIQILDNDGSNYSKTVFHVATETIPNAVTPPAPPSGGGGGGGGVKPPIDPVKPIIDPNQPLDPEAGTGKQHNPYITGYPDSSFKPNGNITREEVATLITRALDKEIKEGYASYKDVTAGVWSEKFISTSTFGGYMTGYPDGTFAPEQYITRAEFASALVRLKGIDTNTVANSTKFSDVDMAKWYGKHVAAAYEMGIINGYEDNTFKPEAPITRAEAVVMMNAYLERNPDTAVSLKTIENPFWDIDNHWGKMHILEASTKHEH